MKQFVTSLCVLTLVSATSCTNATRDGEAVSQRASSGTAVEEVSMVANKPVTGETAHTFNLSVPSESVTLTQGKEVPVRIGIDRGENFGEPVEILVSGLPKGVTVESKKSIASQGSTGVDLTLKAADDAAPGDHIAMVTGRTTNNGDDFSTEIKLTVSRK